MTNPIRTVANIYPAAHAGAFDSGAFDVNAFDCQQLGGGAGVRTVKFIAAVLSFLILVLK